MSGKFQVVNVTSRSGTGKGGKPYSLLVVDGVFTNEKGERATCEHVVFADKDGVLPNFQSGVTYEPILTPYVSRDKKLSAGVFELRPISAVASVDLAKAVK